MHMHIRYCAIALSALLLAGCGPLGGSASSSAASSSAASTPAASTPAASTPAASTSASSAFAGTLADPEPLCIKTLKPILAPAIKSIPGSQAVTVASELLGIRLPHMCGVQASLAPPGYTGPSAAFVIVVLDHATSASSGDPIYLSFESMTTSMHDAGKAGGLSEDQIHLPKRMDAEGWTYGTTDLAADDPPGSYVEENFVFVTTEQVLRCRFRGPENKLPAQVDIQRSCSGVRDALHKG